VFYVIAFGKVVTLDVKVVTLVGKVVITVVKIISSFGKVVTPVVIVATPVGKVVIVDVKVVTANAPNNSRLDSYNSRHDSFVQTIRLDKTEVAKGGTSCERLGVNRRSNRVN